MPKALVWPFFLLIALLGYTINDLRFAISRETPITTQMMVNPDDLSYVQQYRLESELKYRVDVANQDKTQKAILLWPKEPYTRILILADGNLGEGINQQSSFEGQLVRCVYRCLPNGLFIQMDDFLQMIEQKFPEYKDQPKLMPTMILNTLARPEGFKGYLQHFRWYYLAWLAVFIVAVAHTIRARFQKR